jgi:hypothetical protein
LLCISLFSSLTAWYLSDAAEGGVIVSLHIHLLFLDCMVSDGAKLDCMVLAGATGGVIVVLHFPLLFPACMVSDGANGGVIVALHLHLLFLDCMVLADTKLDCMVLDGAP